MPQSQHFPDNFYRVSVKGLFIKDGKVMLAFDTTCHKNGKRTSLWELPGGGMDFGETFEETLRREINEEMGLEVTWVAPQPTYVWTWKKMRSRKLDWYYTAVIAFRFDVKDLHISPTPECEDIRFFSKKDMQRERDNLNKQVQPLIELFSLADFT